MVHLERQTTGNGLAIDLDMKDAKRYAWMCENAPKYGFYLQGAPTKADGSPNPEYEAWHWQFCLGDKKPPALSGQAAPTAPAAAPPAPAAAPKPAHKFPGVLKKGSKGEGVKLVQEKVGRNPDGDFGQKTHDSVVAWQKANKLTADGVVGEKTWSAMFG